MPLTVPIAHDFVCPWCWAGWLQAKRLVQEFGVRLDWRGYELWPEELGWPEPRVRGEKPANRPPTPSRLDLLLAAEGLELPKADRPKRMRTHNAHEAVEYAKSEGVADELVEALYRAYWEEGEEIDEPKVLKKVAKGIVDDVDALLKAVEKRRFRDQIVPFDEEAYARGVYNVPTFFIGAERLAEQPYVVLRKAVQAALEEGSWAGVYASLDFPTLHEERPYVFVNMVATIDGKTVSGTRDESVADLGSKIDHKLLRRLECAADGVMVGAQTLRATSPAWSPRTETRVVVSRSGRVPQDAAFFREGQAYVATTGSASFHMTNGARILRAGGERLDFDLLLSRLYDGVGVRRLLVLGGATLNGELLRRDLVDELFLTIAPKVKLGRDVPTYAGGEAFAREQMPGFRIVEHHVIGDEVFLRYRRDRKK